VSQLHTPAIEAFALPQLAAADAPATAEVSERPLLRATTSALARQPCVSTTTALGLQFSILLVDVPDTGREELGWRTRKTTPDVVASGRRLARQTRWELPIRPTGIGGDMVLPCTLRILRCQRVLSLRPLIRMSLPLLLYWKKKNRISEITKMLQLFSESTHHCGNLISAGARC
jgi:hypothetical protein